MFENFLNISTDFDHLLLLSCFYIENMIKIKIYSLNHLIMNSNRFENDYGSLHSHTPSSTSSRSFFSFDNVYFGHTHAKYQAIWRFFLSKRRNASWQYISPKQSEVQISFGQWHTTNFFYLFKKPLVSLLF